MALQDTYRGRVCECPAVDGVQYEGDGYKECKPVGPGRCAANNGGCWKETRHGKTFSACKGSESLSGCECPPGFKGDGLTCEGACVQLAQSFIFLPFAVSLWPVACG